MKTLRARLLVLTATLLAVGILAIDVATVVALRSYLTTELDQQLEQAREPLVRRVGPIDNNRPQPPPGATRNGPGIGLSDFYIEIRRSDGSVDTEVPSALRSQDYPVPRTSTQVVAERVDTGPFTLPSGTVDYRAIIVSAPDGSGTVTIAAPLDGIDDTLDRVIAIEVIATVAALGILIAVGWVVIRRDLRPLEDITVTAGKIAKGDLSLRVDRADHTSEVGQLGLAFNRMLTDIESSFDERMRSEERLRQFAADASHELRTPLTAVRGYAELYRQGAVQDKEHLERVMSRIESEAKRMSQVVEDLMLLSRLDQGRPIANDPVDLNSIVRDCVSDARVIAPERTFDLHTPGELLQVTGDAERLTQVITNLLSNAIRHTPADTSVEIELTAKDAKAFVRVKDHGPGLNEESARRIFERFYRVDEGRSRESGGSGLGLSIVEALVRAHGGTIKVGKNEPHGAIFEVALPLHLDPQGKRPGS